ncbi:MAG: HAMP domain-containing histidine kinase [Timaviella obliquedivisa GSE-PSE-MK23-08B]|jgi:signal transduction histidine kinase|nr:HAMP domain-containing histidine kinase [Timaviella obliquedivisa GSE-PSE-MK23-08B]
MLLITAAAVPIFRWLLFSSVDSRVRSDLAEEMADFRESYLAWEDLPEQSTIELRQFIDRFLSAELPEDDNFFIAVIDGQFYRSSPSVLVEPLRPNSDLVNRWSNLVEPTIGERETGDPKIGKVIYLVQPLMLDGRLKGVFAVAHLSAGERVEALVGVYIFAGVAVGVVLLSFLLAWLATGLLLAPVRQLAETARAIVSESDLSQRIANVQGNGELAEMTEVFNAMMERIQKAFDTQRDFINDAGHELRTPITIIQGHLELIGEVPPEQQETIDLVMDELDRMNRFVNDLILLAKAERGDFLQSDLIDTAVFIDDLFSKATSLADRKWHLVNRCSETWVGDRQRLTGAVLNLVQNATQHTQPNDLIEIGAVSDEATVRFWVRDSGEGISLEDQKRIFDRFARAANSYRRSEGVGLGLAIVKAIVMAHQGWIELVSHVGAGSTFTLVIPLQPSTPRKSRELLITPPVIATSIEVE